MAGRLVKIAIKSSEESGRLESKQTAVFERIFRQLVILVLNFFLFLKVKFTGKDNYLRNV